MISTLTVGKGEFFAVLGPNAAGKTTTIKVLAGLIKPTSGSAKVAGFDVQKHPLEVRKRLAYVPDFPFLYDKLTPWEFFRFTGQIFLMEDQQIQKAGSELIHRFNLGDFANKPIEGLSHGTRQRVAIVSALLHDPEVFVIDEPMVGLDPYHARVVKDVLKERSTRGMTVFLSTHQLSVAEEMADRIGIIHQGRLIAVGTPDHLRDQSGRRVPWKKPSWPSPPRRQTSPKTKAPTNPNVLSLLHSKQRGQENPCAPDKFLQYSRGLCEPEFEPLKTMGLTKSQLTEAIATKTGVDKKTADALLECLAQLAYEHAKDEFTLPGIGKLVLVDRAARTARNPQTGAEIQVPAKKALKFRVAKAAKDAILGPRPKPGA